jgi:presequence protease
VFSTDIERKAEAKQEESALREHIPRGKNRVPYTFKVGDVVHGFKVTSIDRVEFFDINAYKLEHEATGARYLHLDCSDMDNVFAVLFRTPPDDHTGKPHILEHLATCGTAKYPVRDPFFNMIKRSLNTYMNAWTGSDFTMYPFSSQNNKDFKNLMSVYLEMAFFPRLDLMDFRQEGHRLEFKEWNDPSSEIELKGVVYNEMKGAMSNPEDAFVHKINENLFAKSQYKFNSGGDPKYIPDLEYKDLKAFHEKYYHPTNSTFMSYGDLDFTKHLEFIGSEVLTKFQRNDQAVKESNIVVESRFPEPVHREYRFMPDLMSEADTQTKLAFSFLCNQLSEDPYEAFCMQILSSLLFDGPNAPFYKNIIEAGVAPNFCPGVGYDCTTKEATFTMGV